MKGKLFKQIFWAAVAFCVLCFSIIVAASYVYGSSQHRDRLWEEVTYVAAGVETAGEDFFVHAAGEKRLTWIAADGRVVESTTESKARETTVLKGFRLSEPKVGQAAVPVEVEENQDMPVLVTDRERLEAALLVLTQLERCEILGDAASVDVTDPSNIQLWYGDDYQVLLGDPDRMDEKITMMNSVIAQHEQQGGYQSGVLDITLTENPNSVVYTPFG